MKHLGFFQFDGRILSHNTDAFRLHSILKKSFAVIVILFFLSATFSQTFAAIPSESPKKVIVIGAGIAGLAAANELKSHNYDVIILEARDRIGGRVVTDHSWNGTALDMGASWISGTIGNPTTELAAKYNAGHIPTDYFNSIVVYDENGTKISKSKLDEINGTYEQFLNYTNNMRANKTNDAALELAVNNFINQTNLSGEAKKEFYYKISWEIENDYAADASDLSLLNYDAVGYLLPGTQDVFPEGYDQIANGLAKDFGLDKILTRQYVKEVDYNAQGVTVVTNQTTFHGDYVISTLPLGVLKHGDVKFSPDLSQDKKDAITHLGMGVFDKAYFIFPKVFWYKNNDTEKDWINYIPNERGHWITFLNIYHIDKEYENKTVPILLGLNVGKYAEQLENKTDQQIGEEGMKALRTIYGSDIPDPVKVIPTRWGQDPFERGSYSYTAINGSNADYDAMALPLNDTSGKLRVFFAGEATTWHYPGLVNGAYITGIREANRLWTSDTGTYDSPLKQAENRHWGMFPEYVMCRPGLELVAKATDNSPACVLANHINHLVSIGWAKDPTLP